MLNYDKCKADDKIIIQIKTLLPEKTRNFSFEACPFWTRICLTLSLDFQITSNITFALRRPFHLYVDRLNMIRLVSGVACIHGSGGPDAWASYIRA